MIRRALLAVLAAAGLSAGCAAPAEPAGEAAGPPSLAVAFFPLADAAATLAGGAVEVVNLTPPGVSPHDVEMNPGQRADLERPTPWPTSVPGSSPRSSRSSRSWATT
jgi:ABC-type Zn uptake system ZnuABC Zn-binding protein ZnuA